MEPRPNVDEFAEGALLERVARQDEAALAEFYDRTSAVLFSVAQSILRDPALAEDVLQDVYLQIWEKAAKFDAALGKPIAWAIALTRNKSLDRLRSLKRREAAHLEYGELPQFQLDASSEAPSNVELNDMAALVREFLNKLPAKKRRAIELCFLGGLPHAEVSQALQEPLGTVKAWIRRGMIELRQQLKNFA